VQEVEPQEEAVPQEEEVAEPLLQLMLDLLVTNQPKLLKLQDLLEEPEPELELDTVDQTPLLLVEEETNVLDAKKLSTKMKKLKLATRDGTRDALNALFAVLH